MHPMDLHEAQSRILKAGRRLLETGLISRTWGNVSCRMDQDRFLITPSGRDYRTLTPADLVMVSVSDLSYAGDRTPSVERGVHGEIYRQYPDAGFVIHTHQENASVVSCMGLSEMPVDASLSHLGGKVLFAPYGLPGTRELQDRVAQLLPHLPGKALIMRNHGALCFGTDDQEAFSASLELETGAQAYLMERGRTLLRNPKLAWSDCPRLVQAFGHGMSDMEATEADWRGLCLQVASHMPSGRTLIPVFSPYVRAWSQTGKTLYPMVDDFAQIIGVTAPAPGRDSNLLAKALKNHWAVLVEGMGGLISADRDEDLSAAASVLEKNCKAAIFCLGLEGVQPLPPEECLQLRRLYLHQYSLQMDIL